MSRTTPDPARPFWVETYYGPGGRAGTSKNPNRGRVGERAGDLCCATVHTSEESRDLEIQIASRRPDIGSVNYGRNP